MRDSRKASARMHGAREAAKMSSLSMSPMGYVYVEGPLESIELRHVSKLGRTD